MGVDARAVLLYGFKIEESLEELALKKFPFGEKEYEEYDTSGWVDFYLDVNDNEQVDDRDWKNIQEFGKGLGITVECTGFDSDEQWVCAAAHYGDWDYEGGTVIESLDIGEYADEKLQAFCDFIGITYGEPKWRLIAYMS